MHLNLYKTITERKNYIHCNWGWYGNLNCYCFEDLFEVHYDDEDDTKDIDLDFENIKIIANIHY